MTRQMLWIVLAVTLLLFASTVSALPVCPLSGLPPEEPLVPPTRCPDAASLSCCRDCADRRMSMQLVMSNIDKVVNTILPGNGHTPVSYSYKVTCLKSQMLLKNHRCIRITFESHSLYQDDMRCWGPISSRPRYIHTCSEL